MKEADINVEEKEKVPTETKTPVPTETLDIPSPESPQSVTPIPDASVEEEPQGKFCHKKTPSKSRSNHSKKTLWCSG